MIITTVTSYNIKINIIYILIYTLYYIDEIDWPATVIIINRWPECGMYVKVDNKIFLQVFLSLKFSK